MLSDRSILIYLFKLLCVPNKAEQRQKQSGQAFKTLPFVF